MDDPLHQVDDALLERARRVLGGTTLTQTIETALSIAITERSRAEATERELGRWSSGSYALSAGSGPEPPPETAEPAAPTGSATGWLLHSSVLGRADDPQVSRRLATLTAASLLHTCAVTELEVLSLARSPAGHRALREDRRRIHPPVPVTDAVCEQALALQARVAEHGRSDMSGPLLLVAACARVHGLTVLHHHPAFELLGALCGLDHERVPTARDPAGRMVTLGATY